MFPFLVYNHNFNPSLNLFLVYAVWIMISCKCLFLLFRFKLHPFILLISFVFLYQFQFQFHVSLLRGRVQDCCKLLAKACSSHKNLSILLTNVLNWIPDKVLIEYKLAGTLCSYICFKFNIYFFDGLCGM